VITLIICGNEKKIYNGDNWDKRRYHGSWDEYTEHLKQNLHRGMNNIKNYITEWKQIKYCAM
jgi:hypothetical protein